MADEATAATETPAAPAPKTNEPFIAKMERLGGVDVFKPEPVEEAEQATETAEAKTEPEKVAKPKAEKKPDAPAANEKLEQLKALAAEVGMVIENGRVLSAERAKIRAISQEKTKELIEQERAVIQRIEDARKAFDEELQFARGVSAFKDSKDFQALAKSLGYEDWNKLQDDVLAQASDPNYRRLLELEKRDKQRAEAEERAKAEAEARQQESARVAAQQRYVTQLSNEMGKSSNKLLASFADDSLFVNQIYNIQKQHYNPATDETITIDDAIKFIPPNGKSLNSVMEGLYQKLKGVFGETQAAPQPAAGTVAKPKPRTDAVPPPKASKPSKVDPTDRRSWMQNAANRFTQAVNEDIRREVNGRGSD